MPSEDTQRQEETAPSKESSDAVEQVSQDELKLDSKPASKSDSTPKKNDPSKADHSNPPTIEQYNAIKGKLTQQILHKQDLSAKLASLEDDIYNMECDYFADSAYGNIVKGFEAFSKTGSAGLAGLNSGQGSNKRRFQYSQDDHIFSLSSASYSKTLMRRQGSGLNSAGSNGSSSPAVSKDDWDEYEDSVEPSNGKSVPDSSGPVASAGSEPSSQTRKRKPRVLDD